MQMCLRNEIPAKRKADNALHKRNYLGPDGFFQGFGVYPWRLLFFFFHDFFRSRRRLNWGRGGDGRAGVLSGTKPLWTERRRRMKVGKRCRALIAQPRSPQDPGALGKHPLMRPPRSSRPRFFGGGGSDPAGREMGLACVGSSPPSALPSLHRQPGKPGIFSRILLGCSDPAAPWGGCSSGRSGAHPFPMEMDPFPAASPFLSHFS